MRASAWALLLALGSSAEAQQPEFERLRHLAATDSGAALVDAVTARPDDARELVRRLLVEAGTASARSDSALLRAARIARAITSAWKDSFPQGQVQRFARLSPVQRRAKIMADSTRWRGNTALARAGPAAAIRLWRAALAQSTALGDTAGIAATTGNIGAGFYRAEELDSAERYLSRARLLAEAIGDARTAYNAIGTLGSVAHDRGRVGEAQTLYTRALALRLSLGDVRGASADRNNIGLLAADAGDLEGARAHYGEALALARRHGLPDAEATALLNLGGVASIRGEYALAARHYEAALSLYRSAGAEADVALVLHNLGLLASRRGDFRSARTRLEEALRIFARVGTATDLVLVRNDLASVAAGMGDLRDALQHLARAEQALPSSPADPDLAAGIALARADINAQLNALPEAERQYVRAEALYRRAGNPGRLADAQQGRALLLAERRQFGPAQELLRSAERAQRAAGDVRSAALTQLMTGHVLHRQGELAGARTVLERSVAELAALRDAVGEAAALGALANVELDAGTPLVAESLYRRALARVASRTAPTTTWQLRAGLGRALHSRGALVAATEETRRAVADVERMASTLTLEDRRASFLADKWDVYAQLALVERAQGEIGRAFAATERMRARQMLDLLARGRVHHGASDSALVARAQDAVRRVAELTQRLEREEGEAVGLRGFDPARTPPAITREALAQSQEEYESIQLALRDSESPYGRIARGEVADWREVARRLGPAEALIEYLMLDSAVLAFVVTADTIRLIDLGAGRRELAALVDFARAMIVRPTRTTTRALPAGWRQPLRRLHAQLIAPLEDAGALDGVRRLTIVPNAELHYLPFAAVIRAADGRGERDEFLIERYEIAYAPSASVWVRLGDRPPASGSGVLALAPRVDALPGSREEVTAIGRLYGPAATVLTGTAASEQALRAATGRHAIVHLATYGVLNKHNPLFSYVSLQPGQVADGRLEVHEVFTLGFQARLLVLSACQTALASGALSDVPAGDDWVGLVRAFLGAGASNVIATLWPVEDRSTARLMTLLHRNLKESESEIAATAAAQRAMLREPATSDPFYWAAVVLVGGPQKPMSNASMSRGMGE